MNEVRIQNLMEAMEQAELSQLLVCNPYSIWYLTGDYVEPGERFFALLLRKGHKPQLFLNRLSEAKHVPQEQITFYADTDNPTDMVAEMLDHSSTLGVDKMLAAHFLLKLQDAGAAAKYVNGSPIMDSLRQIKDAEEQEKMAIASHLNDIAMVSIRSEVRLGITERQLAKRLLEIYEELGAEGISFDPIVSFGAHAADPHHMPDDTVLTENQCVLFDIGCIKDGYCSDMTRTFYFGEPTEEERKIHDLVRRANAAGEAAIRPGVRFCDIDRAARQVIEDAGYGQYFTHRLGHGCGIECHECGDVSCTNEAEVKEGMIFSCEPGVYLPWLSGVRIEDLCLVTKDGVKVLNKVPKKLMTLPIK